MEVIMSEKRYAERLLKDMELNVKPLRDLSIIAKYYRHILGMKSAEIYERLDKIMEVAYPGYIKNNWAKSLNKIIKSSKTSELVDVESIPITQSELDAIKSLRYVSEKKVAFTLLVLAKFFNIRSGNNSDWVNCEPKTVFQHANILGFSMTDRANTYRTLTEKGIISYSIKTGSANAKVMIVDHDGEAVLQVKDLRSLGNLYAKINGDNYIECDSCGVLIRQNKYGNKKRCNKCKKPSPVLKYKILNCVVCGEEMFVREHACMTKYCSSCFAEMRRQKAKEAYYEKQNKI